MEANETAMSVSEVAEQEQVTVSAVYKWIYQGAGGRQLEAFLRRGVIHTTREALARFNAPQPLPGPTPEPRTSRQRLRASERAGRALAARGA